MPALKYWDAGSNQYVLLMPGTPTTFPFVYTQTLSAPTVAASPYQVNHNLNTNTPLVQTYDAITGQLVMLAITVVNANSIQVSVSVNAPNNINVVVVGTAQSPVPVQPADVANKSYVDARTPNLPGPVTSGTTVQSFTDVLGDVWVALNGVSGGAWKRARDVLYAKAWRNAAYNSLGNVFPIMYDTIYRDPYGMYNLSTGYFTCPVAGLWEISSLNSCSATATGQFQRTILQVTPFGGGASTGHTQSFAHSSFAALVGVPVTATAYCGAGDYWFCQVANSVTMNGNPGLSGMYGQLKYLGTG